jgi:hypothetical protein
MSEPSAVEGGSEGKENGGEFSLKGGLGRSPNWGNGLYWIIAFSLRAFSEPFS